MQTWNVANLSAAVPRPHNSFCRRSCRALAFRKCLVCTIHHPLCVCARACMCKKPVWSTTSNRIAFSKRTHNWLCIDSRQTKIGLFVFASWVLRLWGISQAFYKRPLDTGRKVVCCASPRRHGHWVKCVVLCVAFRLCKH